MGPEMDFPTLTATGNVASKTRMTFRFEKISPSATAFFTSAKSDPSAADVAAVNQRMIQGETGFGSYNFYGELLHGDKVTPICTGDRFAEIPLRYFAQVMGHILRHIVQTGQHGFQSPCQLGGFILGPHLRGRRTTADSIAENARQTAATAEEAGHFVAQAGAQLGVSVNYVQEWFPKPLPAGRFHPWTSPAGTAYADRRRPSSQAGQRRIEWGPSRGCRL